jgi:hypothetical protein
VFRSSASTSYVSNVTTTVLAKPVGTVDGDVMIAGIMTGYPDPTQLYSVPPAGWTVIGTPATVTDVGSFDGSFSLFWKRASAEGESYSFTHGGAGVSSQGVIASYSGCHTSGSPIEAFSQNSANTGATATGAGIAPSSSNTKLLYIGNNWDGTKTLAPPTGMTERFDDIAYLADEDRFTSGATGDRTQTLASSGAPWQAYMVALKPSGPVSTYTVTAVPGSYRITGTTVTTGRGLLATVGSYVMTGSAATLLHRNGKGLFAAAGSYRITGRPATMAIGAVVVPPSGLSGMSVWTGSAWVDKPAKVWTGSAWVEKPVKVWNGSSWV